MKKILSCIAIGVFLITISGCGNSNNSKQTSSNKDNSVEKKVQANKNEPKKEAEFQTVSKNKVNKIENNCEFTIVNTKIGKKIIPPNPSGMYTYYEAKEPNTLYLDTIINVKSLLTEGKSSDKFLNVEILYDNKYKYDTFSVIEEKGGSNFTFTNITSIEPLKTGSLHFIAEIPKEVQKNNKSLIAIIKLNNEEFRYTIR